MSYRYRSPDGQWLEADSAQELRELLDAVGIQFSSAQQIPAGLNKPSPDTRQEQSLTDKLWAFYSRLRSDEQKRLLQTLAGFDDWLSDDQLRGQLAMTKKSALGGFMGALVKNASAVNLKFYKHVLTKESKRGSAGRYFNRYRLTSEMRDVLRDKLGIQRVPQMFEDPTGNGAGAAESIVEKSVVME